MKNRAQKKKSVVRLFRGISKLATLEGAVRKDARRISDEDLGWIPNAAFLVEEGRLLAVGGEKTVLKRAKTLSGTHEVLERDLGNRVVTPAFVESHTHLIYGGNRAGEFERRNLGESYTSIAKSGGGILATVNPTRAACLDELVAIGQLRADRYLAQGVTTIEAKSGYGLETETELKLMRAAGKIRRARIVRTFLGAHAVPIDFASADSYLDHLIEVALPILKSEGLGCRVDIFVEDGYFAKGPAKRYLTAARKMGFDLVIHADQLTLSGGADLAVELGARSADHLVRITPKEIAKLAKSEVTCVLLPNADLYMNCAYPPARSLIDEGARVAIATDLNPGTAPCQDLALAGVLARIQMKMTLAEVFVSYTLGGAFALGLGRELGALVKGRWADFNVLSGAFEETFLEIGRMPVAEVFREGEKMI